MKKIKTFLVLHKSELLIGIIVSIITSAFWACYNAIKNSAPEIGRSIISLFRGIVYTSAAKQNADSLLSLFIAAVTGIGFAAISILIVNSMRFVNNAIEVGNKNIKNTMPTKRDNQVDEDDIGKKDPNAALVLIKQAKRTKILLICYCVLLLLMAFFFVLHSFLPHSLWCTFQKDITLIAPYADNSTILTLQSDWIRMRTKDNYDQIYLTIEKIKKENTLP